jgi:alpha-2-macroglobulin
MLAGDLGDAFRLPGIDAAKAKEIARSTLKELEEFQCPGGGFAFWKGSCRLVSPYLTSYVLSVFQRGERLSYEVNRGVLEEGYRYLEHELATPIPGDEGWWPAYTAWQTFAVKVLAEGGRNVDSHVNRLFERLDRMPVFALAYLSDAMAVRGEPGARPEELKRRISNAILPEGGSAHVEELADPYLLWFWNSSIRSTAIVLESLVRRGNDSTFAPGMVRWLLAARKDGRWGNTQENALALGALVEYYRRFEKEVPDFKSAVTLGEKTIARETFAGRSSESRAREVPMKELLAGTEPGRKMPLDFRKEGPGTLYYAALLRYIVDASQYAAMDQGIAVERIYQIERDGKTGEPASTCAAGDLVRVTLTLKLPKERRYVAVTDPLPAGLEPVEAWFATTAAGLAREQREAEDQGGDWMTWWQRGGFDHVERHDDRVLLFATRLSEGSHTFSYLARATTAGSFRAASARAEEMYEPEVFGRTASAAVEVKP